MNNDSKGILAGICAWPVLSFLLVKFITFLFESISDSEIEAAPVLFAAFSISLLGSFLIGISVAESLRDKKKEAEGSHD